jgi:hypothetical protein
MHLSFLSTVSRSLRIIFRTLYESVYEPNTPTQRSAADNTNSSAQSILMTIDLSIISSNCQNSSTDNIERKWERIINMKRKYILIFIKNLLNSLLLYEIWYL